MEGEVIEGINLEFRPDTYFPESRDRAQLLSNIKGQARRELASRQLDEQGFTSLDTFIARPELDDDQREAWGRVHPWMMGGEFLPDFESGEVEIARVSLKSTTFDQISVRARKKGDHAHLSVEDEYETEFELPFDKVTEPLSLGQLIEMLNGTDHPDDIYGGGLVFSHWNYLDDEHYHPAECVDFATVESAFYPELESYYLQYGKVWVTKKMEYHIAQIMGCEMADISGFLEKLHPEWTLERLFMLDEELFELLEKRHALTPDEFEDFARQS